MLADPGCGAFFGVAANLADHDDEVRVGVVFESFQGIDVSGSHNRVAANADAGRKSQVAQLVHELVGQSARLRHQAQAARTSDIGRSNADIALSGADNSGAIRANQAHAALKCVINESS